MRRPSSFLASVRALPAIALAALALSFPAVARAQAPAPGCDDLPAEPVSLGEPTGFRIVVRAPGDIPLDACHTVRAENARRLAAFRAWQPGDLVPFGFHPEYKPREGLIRAGAITAGVSYALGLAIGLAAQNGGYYAALPVAGPFIAAAAYRRTPTPCNAGFGCIGVAIADGFDSSIVRALLITTGIGQVAGTALIVAGVAARKWTLVRDDVPRVMPVPMMGPHGGGLGLVGTF